MIAHEDEEADEKLCSRCGAPESQWIGFENKGFVGGNGELYCCQTCAEGGTCDCNLDRLESLVKRRIA